jgi:hypothetical protein
MLFRLLRLASDVKTTVKVFSEHRAYRPLGKWYPRTGARLLVNRRSQFGAEETKPDVWADGVEAHQSNSNLRSAKKDN